MDILSASNFQAYVDPKATPNDADILPKQNFNPETLDDSFFLDEPGEIDDYSLFEEVIGSGVVCTATYCAKSG